MHCRTSPPVCQHGVLQNPQRPDPPRVPVGRARTRLVTAPRLRPANHPKPTPGLRGLRRSASRVWAVAIERSSDFRTCTTVRSVERSRSPRRPHSTMIAASGAALPAITFHGVMDRTAPCRRSDSAGSACDVGDEPVEVRVMPRPFRRRGPRWKEARGRLRLTRGRRPASPRRPCRLARCSWPATRRGALPGSAARARDQLCALDDLAGRPEARGRRDREPRPQVWRRQPGELADGARGRTRVPRGAPDAPRAAVAAPRGWGAVRRTAACSRRSARTRKRLRGFSRRDHVLVDPPDLVHVQGLDPAGRVPRAALERDLAVASDPLEDRVGLRRRALDGRGQQLVVLEALDAVDRYPYRVGVEACRARSPERRGGRERGGSWLGTDRPGAIPPTHTCFRRLTSRRRPVTRTRSSRTSW